MWKMGARGEESSGRIRGQETSEEDALRVQEKETEKLKDTEIKHIPILNLFTSSFSISLLSRTLSVSSTPSRPDSRFTDDLYILDDIGKVL